MKTLFRVLGVVAVVVFFVYFNLSYPDVQQAADLTIERLPERIARGQYLANHVTVCIDCHSTRDWSKFAGPIIPGTEGKGGEEFNEQVGGVPGCGDCHTPAVKGAPVPGMDFAGGFEFLFPGGVIRSMNITPDIETGIGEWTKADFVARFKAFESEESRDVSVAMTEFNTPMPWLMYSGMADGDLGAIYDYLRTMKPVKNHVEKFTPSKPAGG